MVAKKVAIIGCGVGGLTAIKSCVDAGLKPTCFEQQSRFGGIWNYTGEVRPNLGSVHKNTVTNISKAIMCFSDFPVPKEWPNYVHHRIFMNYLEMYAKEFDLEPYIKLNTKVERLSKTDDHTETGRWTVRYTRNSDGSELTNEETFDAVMICNGHHAKPAIPKIPGMEKFKGVKVHSGDYRTFHPYVGKRVLVVGCSFSAGDIASDLSQHASQVYLSTTRGAYIVRRLTPGTTKPFDHQLTRAESFLNKYFRRSLVRGWVNHEYDFASLGLQPTGILGIDQFVLINDDLPDKVFNGQVIVKDQLKEFRETSVVFNSEDVLDDIDAVVFSTGFKLDYPFATDIVTVESEKYARLYKQIFIPDAEHQTLAIIGVPEVLGPHIPIWEMQARVAAEVFAGRCSLPSKDVMLTECIARERELVKIGRPKEKFLNGIEFVSYFDELGEMIGVTPSFLSMLLKSPKMAYEYYFGAHVPAQYRLQGPNTWEKAAEVIMRTEEDYLHPLKTKRCSPLVVQKKSYFYRIVAFVVFVAIVLRFLF